MIDCQCACNAITVAQEASWGAAEWITLSLFTLAAIVVFVGFVMAADA